MQAAINAFVATLDRHDPFVAAFSSALIPMVVTDPTLPDNPLIYVNGAFESLTGFSAAEVIGRNCRFMQGPLSDANDVSDLRNAIGRHERFQIDILNHHRDGTPFWNRLIVAPVFDVDDNLRYFVGSQPDVTIERDRLVSLEQEKETLAADLAAREAAVTHSEARLMLALRAGGLGTWIFDPASGELTASKSCKATFGRDPDRPMTYTDLLGMIHPADLPRQQAAVLATIESGVPLHVEYRILTEAGDQRWIAIQGEMQYRADGSALLLSGFSTDISERKFAEEHREVLARELTHRVKNTLATVGAVVTQTLRDAASLDDARIAVQGRIASLSVAHELLIKDEVEGASIGDVVAHVLAPFSDREGKRIVAQGPQIRLSPDLTLALSMSLHELATNAVKYGALSNANGVIAINWDLEEDERIRHIRFSWVEQGGPNVEEPTRIGFGSRMIKRVLTKHLRRPPTVSYFKGGLHFEIQALV